MVPSIITGMAMVISLNAEIACCTVLPGKYQKSNLERQERIGPAEDPDSTDLMLMRWLSKVRED